MKSRRTIGVIAVFYALVAMDAASTLATLAGVFDHAATEPAGRGVSHNCPCAPARTCQENCCCGPGSLDSSGDQTKESPYRAALAIASCGQGQSEPVGLPHAPLHLGVPDEVVDGAIRPVGKISDSYRVGLEAFIDLSEKVPIPLVST